MLSDVFSHMGLLRCGIAVQGGLRNPAFPVHLAVQKASLSNSVLLTGRMLRSGELRL
jgi:hypothetical protein